jgi:hypothetical protein
MQMPQLQLQVIKLTLATGEVNVADVVGVSGNRVNLEYRNSNFIW